MTTIIITTKSPPSSSPTRSPQSLIDDEVEEVLLAQQEEQNGFGEKLSAEARIEVNCPTTKSKIFILDHRFCGFCICILSFFSNMA